jgi:hemolysin-activating ACP:hemolysin acyltransferase
MLFRSKSKAELDGSAAAAPSVGNDGKAGEASATLDGAVSSKSEADGGGSTAGSTASTKEAQRLALSAIRQSVAFAQIVTVLMRSPRYRHYTLGDLEWLVVPALKTGQWRVVGAQSKQNGVSFPVAVALWARVSPEVDKKLSENLHVPIRLRPDEWQSGDILWLVDAVGDSRAVPQLLKQLIETSFKGREAKVRAAGEDGKIAVRRLGTAAN